MEKNSLYQLMNGRDFTGCVILFQLNRFTASIKRCEGYVLEAIINDDSVTLVLNSVRAYIDSSWVSFVLEEDIELDLSSDCKIVNDKIIVDSVKYGTVIIATKK